MSLWTDSEAAAATGGQSTSNWQATGVSIDTRSLQLGDLFVALKDVRDGHDFVADALANGAAAALVSRVPDGVAPDAPLLIVEDVLAGLEALGRAGRERMSGRVAAITGSVGKTSTKEMLLTMLSVQGRTHASVASYNNHWGVPLTLARMPRDTEYAIIEIGMNHPGEISPLAQMARPHVAMVTTVAAAHLEAFEGVEGIAREKAAIIDGVEPGGIAVLNRDIETANVLKEYAKTHDVNQVGFGQSAGEYLLQNVDRQGEVTVAQASARGVPVLFKLGSPGAHFAMNALGALAVVEALGADLGLAASALRHWSPYKGRGVREVISFDPVEPGLSLDLIDDSYNANPTSVAAALAVLAEAETTRSGRRIAILGDMKELGDDGPALHAALAGLTTCQSIEKIHCVGPLMRHLHEVLPVEQRGVWAETSADLVPLLKNLLGVGDVVLVKASLSMRFATLVDAIRKMGHAAPADEQG